MTHDPVNQPAHYRAGGIEAIDVIEAFNLCFRLGNVVKYVLRAGRKLPGRDTDPDGVTIEDLKKARWYLDREIARRESVARPTSIQFRADEFRCANPRSQVIEKDAP